ncbi:ankyrin repeat-containing domain protein [Xylariales sp. AK1849]|nr:ankyrin repeat-containing domain protein [Xylariales sp. AK1849]
MDKLPVECVAMIADCCSQASKALLCCSCKSFQQICEPRLYKTDVDFHGSAGVLSVIVNGDQQSYICNSLRKFIKANADFTKSSEMFLPVVHPYNYFNASFFESVDHYGTPLHWAAYRGHDQVLSLLLDHLGIDSIDTLTNAGGWTPLLIALCYGQDCVTNILLEVGANVSVEGLHMNALHVAAAADDHAAMRYMVVELDIPVDIEDSDGCAPLHYVMGSATVTPEAITCLYALGADIDKTVFYKHRQHSTLDIAYEYERWDLTIKLLQLGANVHAPTHYFRGYGLRPKTEYRN